MNTRTIKLLPGSRNAFVFSATDKETILHYTCPAWPDKVCIHILSGKWEIESTEANKVNLITHDEVIKTKPYNIKKIQPLIID